MTKNSSISLAEALNNANLGKFQIRVIAICFAVAMLDGFDTQSIAFVAPALKKIWAVPANELGFLFSASLLGTILGASGLGALADRMGRKTIIAVSVLIFGILSRLMRRLLFLIPSGRIHTKYLMPALHGNRHQATGKYPCGRKT
jgi:AAHS family 4-hydroxybenzoate transporter-like MFS transporter|tara:strand:+ start:10743 stop:11177 length:435 start_codon:yes stop_codon:yes gene_type:complete